MTADPGASPPRKTTHMLYDAVIVGGGPAGLSAALTLGRGRRRVLLADAGPPRNAAATHVHGFLTRDGTPPAELRRLGRAELARYPSVEVRDVRVLGVDGESGAFDVRLEDGGVEARRVLLTTGMVDVMPELDGFAELWGHSIFQCPYCHGYEVQDRRFGFLAPSLEMLDFAIFLRGWTSEVVAFTDGRFEVPTEARDRLTRAGVRLEERRLARLIGADLRLERVELTEGPPVPVDVLFARPVQRQVPVVTALGLELDPMGFVRVHEMTGETSRAGVYAAGDLTTMAQGAILGAASGMRAAAGLNHGLALDPKTMNE